MTKKFKYSIHSGYECSTKGDKRFSAFTAIMEDGRTIEQHYQCDVKAYDPGGTDWRMGKGKPPLTPMGLEALYKRYLGLWKRWALDHPSLMEELRMKAIEHDYTLRDSFATTHVNQARALAQILNEMQGD
jgi:hypothetical protein